MAGLLIKTINDDGTSDRTTFSGFKITLGMSQRLRAEVSTKQANLDDTCTYSSVTGAVQDFVEHPLLLNNNEWYTASLNISSTWIQIYVNSIPGPVKYNCFENVANNGDFYFGQDRCCGSTKYKFVGSIKNIILYSSVNSEPELKMTATSSSNASTRERHKIAAICIGIILVIITMCIIAYLRYLKEYEQSELERINHLHESFVPPEKIKGSAAWKYEHRKKSRKR